MTKTKNKQILKTIVWKKDIYFVTYKITKILITLK